jgi:hypothetical protein
MAMLRSRINTTKRLASSSLKASPEDVDKPIMTVAINVGDNQKQDLGAISYDPRSGEGVTGYRTRGEQRKRDALGSLKTAIGMSVPIKGFDNVAQAQHVSDNLYDDLLSNPPYPTRGESRRKMAGIVDQVPGNVEKLKGPVSRIDANRLLHLLAGMPRESWLCVPEAGDAGQFQNVNLLWTDFAITGRNKVVVPGFLSTEEDLINRCANQMLAASGCRRLGRVSVNMYIPFVGLGRCPQYVLEPHEDAGDGTVVLSLRPKDVIGGHLNFSTRDDGQMFYTPQKDRECIDMRTYVGSNFSKHGECILIKKDVCHFVTHTIEQPRYALVVFGLK